MCDRYEEIKVIGTGAFGSAILVRRKLDEGLFVMKKVSLHNMQPHEREQTMNEVEVIKQLTHPCITGYYEDFVEDQHLHIIIEYADSGNLEAVVKERKGIRFEENEILYKFIQILLALQHVHSKNILHRDLKTQNVFLHNAQRNVKLGDFGISKVLSETRGMAQTMVGTPYYLSPELCQGEQYDQKSDIWALGCILYEMCALQHAFYAENIGALVMRVMGGKYNPIHKDYSDDVRNLIHSLLQRNPDDRATLAEVLALPFLQPVIEEFRAEKEVLDKKAQSMRSTFKPGSAFNEIKDLANQFTESQKIKDSSPPAAAAATPAVAKAGGNVALHWGQGTTVTVLNELVGLQVAYVACGAEHAAAVTQAGALYTWGKGADGQLGRGDMASAGSPLQVPGFTGASVVACGDSHTIAVDKDGTVFTCGSDVNGQLGQGKTSPANMEVTFRKVDALVGTVVRSVVCGNHHNAALSDVGDLYTWGLGSCGQLGHTSMEDEVLPRRVETLGGKVVLVACGDEFTGAIGDNENLYTFGCGVEGQLGHDNEENVSTPTAVKGLIRKGVKAVAMGSAHVIAVTECGIFAWGNSELHQCGHSNTTTYTTPRKLRLPKDDLFSEAVAQVLCGKEHSGFIFESGSIVTFGSGLDCRLGYRLDVETQQRVTQRTPKLVEELADYKVLQGAFGNDGGIVVAVKK